MPAPISGLIMSPALSSSRPVPPRKRLTSIRHTNKLAQGLHGALVGNVQHEQILWAMAKVTLHATTMLNVMVDQLIALVRVVLWRVVERPIHFPHPASFFNLLRAPGQPLLVVGGQEELKRLSARARTRRKKTSRKRQSPTTTKPRRPRSRR